MMRLTFWACIDRETGAICGVAWDRDQALADGVADTNDLFALEDMRSERDDDDDQDAAFRAERDEAIAALTTIALQVEGHGAQEIMALLQSMTSELEGTYQRLQAEVAARLVPA